MDRATLFKGIDPSLVVQILSTCKLADLADYSEAQSQQVLKEIERLNAVKAEGKKKDSPPTKVSPQSGGKPRGTASSDQVVAEGAVLVRDAVFENLSETIDVEMGSLAELDAPRVRKMMVTAYMGNLAKAMQELPPLTTAEIIDVDAVRQHLLAGGKTERQLPPGKSS